MSQYTIVCLLPVRNGEQDLPGYFESVATFADAIIALDDGSIDRTVEMLEANPLVKRILRNPSRPDYVGWDDAANRNQLLEAVAEFEPTWIVSLDADERIPADDAAALRAFLENEALPGLAYGQTVFKMWNDMDHYAKEGLWVNRIFAWEPGQRFPDRRLHFVPIPTSIPRSLWVKTTIRIQHLGGYTKERRNARFAKYQQADPNLEFQKSYKDVIEEDLTIAEWQPRDPELPVLWVNPAEVEIAIEDATHPSLDEIVDRPVMSAVIISRGDGDKILPSVTSVVNQVTDWPFEAIVVTSGPGNAGALVRERFPDVTVIELPNPALPGAARNAGLRMARGEYITFPGSHIELPQGSLQARMLAHDLGYSMVTGAVLNGTPTRSGWASYFIDHPFNLPTRPSGELAGAPAHCSYRRNALEAVDGFPEHLRAGEDTVVNNALAEMGHKAYFSADIRFTHASRCRTPWRLARHHYERGRSLGRIWRERGDPALSLNAPRSTWKLARRHYARRRDSIAGYVATWGDADTKERYRQVRPLVHLALLANTAGLIWEMFRNSASENTTPTPASIAGTPADS